jgi:hypothetical protein
MGCGGSKTEAKPAQPPVQVQPVLRPVRTSKVGKPNKHSKFQWKDAKGWNDYDPSTDAKLKQAFLVGRQGARFQVKTKSGMEEYEFSFSKGHMAQKNVKTGNGRQIRQPYGMFQPKEAVLPEGDFIVVVLTANQVGQEMIEVSNPRDKSQTIQVSIPKKARKGQKIAVPIPAAGEKLEDVAKRQEGMTMGAKVATGLGISAVAGAAVLGGVVLGDHLAGGTLLEQAVDVAADAGDVAIDVAGDVGDFAVDAADTVGDFAEDVGDWLGDAGEDVGDWICSVF